VTLRDLAGTGARQVALGAGPEALAGSLVVDVVNHLEPKLAADNPEEWGNLQLDINRTLLTWDQHSVDTLSVWESVLKAALGRSDRSQADIPQVSGHAKDLRQDLGRLHGVLADRDVLAEVVFQQWNAALSGLPGRVGSFWQQYGTANPQGTPSPVR